MAIERTNLLDVLEGLPPGVFLVGDAAYTLQDRVLVPFTGSQRDQKHKDAFNFFLSQLRIRIEMAFGLLTNKWQILRNNLQCRLSKCSDILECCARLHNYVITEEGDDNIRPADIPPLPDSPLGWGYLPTVEALVRIPGTSQVRDIIVRKIRRDGLLRPAENVARRQQELHQLELM